MDFNPSNLPLDFEKGFTLPFDLKTGMSAAVDTGKRHLADMKGMFADAAAETRAIEDGNPLIYEFHSLPAPNHGGDLAFGCSIVYPGKVGDEYYMTKGHFHTILETGEVYYWLHDDGKSRGRLALPGADRRKGRLRAQALRPSLHLRGNHRAAGHLLRLPRRCGAQLRHH